jgi:hypothetical protein
LTISEIWLKGKAVVTKNRILFLLPFLLDLVLYGPLAFISARVINFKLTVPSSLPTIQNLLPEAAMFSGAQSGVNFNMGYPGTLTVGFAGTIIAFTLVPYLTGGYLGTIVQELRGDEERMPFMALASKYFVRLFIMRILVMVAFMGLVLILTIVPFLAFIMVPVLIAVTVLLLFWDFSIVYDDMDLIPAISKAYAVMKGNLPPVINNLLPVIILLMPLTLGASLLVGSPLFLLVIAVYAYIGAVIISGLVYLYSSLVTGEYQE